MKQCDGMKYGKKCESDVYKCVKCGAIGCDQPACNKQNFQANQCKKCNVAAGKQPVY